MSGELPPIIVRARIRLMLDEPYLASAVARMPMVCVANEACCPTMATDGYHVFINPAFAGTLAGEEIVFVLAHELLHCVLGHIDRRGVRDHHLWNVAIDYATNLMLVDFGFKMPAGGLLDTSYKGMNAEDIYDRLLKSSQNGHVQLSTWIDGHLEPGKAKGAISPLGTPSMEERSWIRRQLQAELSVKLVAGRRPASLEKELAAAASQQVPWQEILARFVSGLRRDDYRLFPPNRKHIWQNLYLPSIGRPGPEHLVVAIDTSGSMSDETLQVILGEIDSLRSSSACRMTLLQADTRVCEVQEYEAHENFPVDNFRVKGRGGTSFSPVFAWITQQRSQCGLHVDALIYLTDGDGSFPGQSPDYPTLWIFIESKVEDPPFGAVIRIK